MAGGADVDLRPWRVAVLTLGIFLRTGEGLAGEDDSAPD